MFRCKKTSTTFPGNNVLSYGVQSSCREFPQVLVTLNIHKRLSVTHQKKFILNEIETNKVLITINDIMKLKRAIKIDS